LSAQATPKRPAPVRALIAAIRWIARLVIALVGVPIAFLVALIQRYRRRPDRPRVFWGAEPLINMKYHSQAAKLAGYESATVVRSVYPMNRPEDFDFVMPTLLRRRLPPLRLLPAELRLNVEAFLILTWALWKFDVFVYYSTSTILRPTLAKYLELQLLGFARKRLVLLAYGADVQATTRMKDLLYKHALSMDYPDFVRQPEETLRTLHYCSRHADHIVAGADWVDYMPWWDSLTAGHFAIDTEEWRPPPEQPAPAGDRPVKVLHAPNHREIKGTRFLISACKELRREGVAVELQVVEDVSNTELHELMLESDIIADQFIIGWYAMFAIEGMALAKPVLCYLRPDLLELYRLYSFAGACPLVNTPASRIKEVLEELAGDPARRAELGARGRRYVEAHHSLESRGRMFDSIFHRVYGHGDRDAVVTA
jgi:glycosyltransferase involved in cell wall biosynthesis